MSGAVALMAALAGCSSSGSGTATTKSTTTPSTTGATVGGAAMSPGVTRHVDQRGRHLHPHRLHRR